MSESDDFGGERHEREWDAQERALREERLGAAPKRRETRVNEYRLLARALGDPALDPIPEDFVTRTAARAVGVEAAKDRLDVWLQHGLIALLAAVGVSTMAALAGSWLQAFGIAITRPAALSLLSWTTAILACIALSEALDYWRRKRGSGGDWP